VIRSVGSNPPRRRRAFTAGSDSPRLRKKNGEAGPSEARALWPPREAFSSEEDHERAKYNINHLAPLLDALEEGFRIELGRLHLPTEPDSARDELYKCYDEASGEPRNSRRRDRDRQAWAAIHGILAIRRVRERVHHADPYGALRFALEAILAGPLAVDAVRGSKTIGGARHGGEVRADEKNEQYAPLVRRAVEVRTGNPKLSMRAVAKELEGKFGVGWEMIRKVIRRKVPGPGKT
jgi:hypothetical protein